MSKQETGNMKRATAQLIPIVYEELRQLARSRLANEQAGQTLTATALVHEAFLRLSKDSANVAWNSNGHFFAAAAEAMRRILIERAKQKKSLKRGGSYQRTLIGLNQIPQEKTKLDYDVLELDDALTNLAITRRDAAEIVKLRFFAGLSISDASQAMGVSERSGYRLWDFAKAFVYDHIKRSKDIT